MDGKICVINQVKSKMLISCKEKIITVLMVFLAIVLFAWLKNRGNACVPTDPGTRGVRRFRSYKTNHCHFETSIWVTVVSAAIKQIKDQPLLVIFCFNICR